MREFKCAKNELPHENQTFTAEILMFIITKITKLSTSR